MKCCFFFGSDFFLSNCKTIVDRMSDKITEFGCCWGHIWNHFGIDLKRGRLYKVQGSLYKFQIASAKWGDNSERPRHQPDWTSNNVFLLNPWLEWFFVLYSSSTFNLGSMPWGYYPLCLFHSDGLGTIVFIYSLTKYPNSWVDARIAYNLGTLRYFTDLK